MALDDFLAATKTQELRDALNVRGIPGGADGAGLNAQAGVRGSPIVDYRCLAGLELYKQTTQKGNGRTVNAARNATVDVLWATNSNNDLSLVMTNAGNNTGSSSATGLLTFGLMLIGNTTSDITAMDVFGGFVSHITLISGTYAWRLPIGVRDGVQGLPGLQNVRSSNMNYPSNSLALWNNRYDFGSSTTPASDRYGHGWQFATSYILGTRFARNPDTAAVYRMTATHPSLGADGTTFSHRSDSSITAATLRVPANAGATLYELMQANYPVFRIYDFTLRTSSGVAVPSEMPSSASGSTADYITDAIVTPVPQPSVIARSNFQTEYAVSISQGTPSSLAINDVASTAFMTRPGVYDFSISVSPASTAITNASYVYDASTDVFTFIPTAAGTYTIVLTAALTSNPLAAATQTLTFVVTES